MSIAIVPPNTSVAGLKEKIRAEMPRKLSNINVNDLVVWTRKAKVTDFDETNQEKLAGQVNKVFSVGEAEQLRGVDRIKATDELLLVQVPPSISPSTSGGSATSVFCFVSCSHPSCSRCSIEGRQSQPTPRPISPRDSRDGAMAVIHRFLWGREDNLGKIRTQGTFRIPAFEESSSSETGEDGMEVDDVAHTDGHTPHETEAVFYDLSKIPNVSELVSQVLEERFYVREEYIELDKVVEGEDQIGIPKKKCRPILLTGQSGIGVCTSIQRPSNNVIKHAITGKTVYLTYCLVNRLAKQQPTFLVKSKNLRYLFLESGVYVDWDHKFDYEGSSAAGYFPDVIEAALAPYQGLTLFDLNSGTSITDATTY